MHRVKNKNDYYILICKLMKKFLFAAALLVLGLGSANAQEGLQKANFWDNWYIGPKIGVTTPLTFNSTFPLNPAVGVKIGKWFSPVFGANIEGLANFGDNGFAANARGGKSVLNSKTFFTNLNVGLNGTINWTNLFLGYNEDKVFELTSETGFGLYHVFGDPNLSDETNTGDNSELTAKTGLTFGWNLGEKKAWQLYVEPAIYWNLTHGPGDCVEMNKHAAQLGLFVGANYKFKTSNGTHNFKKISLDPLNDEINDLRAQLAQKPKEVIKEVIKEVPVKETESKEVRIDNLYFVTFQQGKSVLVKDAKAALDNIQAGSHVEIVGTASPEGSKELNDRLSQARAEAVAKYLQDRGVIVDSATGKGVQGVTSNRLAVVYVK